MTERFSRPDPDTILYEYTIDDACHEGNYGIVGSLSGARAVDKLGGSHAAAIPKSKGEE